MCWSLFKPQGETPKESEPYYNCKLESIQTYAWKSETQNAFPNMSIEPSLRKLKRNTEQVSRFSRWLSSIGNSEEMGMRFPSSSSKNT